MHDDILLNVPLLRRRVPNLTVAARTVGLRPATVSDLCTGKIPLGRAEVRTLVALASLAGCTLDELVVQGAGIGLIETGIKVWDLFAPLVRGGTVGLVARQGQGQMVALAELMHRLRRLHFAVVLWSPGDAFRGLDPDLAGEADVVCTTLADVRQQVSTLRAERDVFVVTERETVVTGDLVVLREQLREPGARPVTFALVDARGEAPDEDTPFGPLETLWRFDMDLMARRILPAVDPVTSTSTLLEGAQLEASHLTVQQRARKLLRRYREWRQVVAAAGMERLPAAELPGYRRGERLEAFLAQPFYVVENWTKLNGQWVTLADTIDSVRRILDGAADDMEVTDIKLLGRLP
ncbi:MAG TPA: hypothetical protein VNT75_17305 [Symbiobacteriaceae bacterium]|nr:hypothetical protein [Symbiobacteriaceae bacterium]